MFRPKMSTKGLN